MSNMMGIKPAGTNAPAALLCPCCYARSQKSGGRLNMLVLRGDLVECAEHGAKPFEEWKAIADSQEH